MEIELMKSSVQTSYFCQPFKFLVEKIEPQKYKKEKTSIVIPNHSRP